MTIAKRDSAQGVTGHPRKFRHRGISRGNAKFMRPSEIHTLHRDIHAASKNSSGIAKFMRHRKTHPASQNSCGIGKFIWHLNKWRQCSTNGGNARFTWHRKIHPESQQMEATLNKWRQREIRAASRNSGGIGKFIRHLTKWRQRSTNGGNARFTRHRKIHLASQQMEAALNKLRQHKIHEASENSSDIAKFTRHWKIHPA